MPKKPTDYHRPTTLEEAVHLMLTPNTTLLGGGTKLLTKDVDKAVIDLQSVSLDKITIDMDMLMVGAMVRLTQLDQFLQKEDPASTPAPLIRQAIRYAGANTYRNAATIGGTIATPVLDSELLATLLLLNAEIAVLTPEPIIVKVEQYLKKPIAGLITHVALEWYTGKGYHERVARTPADTPIVSVASWQPTQGSIRLAATGIDDAVVAMRLSAVEAILAKGLSPDTIEKAGTIVGESCRHSGDFRGSASYRTEMLKVLTQRILASV